MSEDKNISLCKAAKNPNAWVWLDASNLPNAICNRRQGKEIFRTNEASFNEYFEIGPK